MHLAPACYSPSVATRSPASIPLALGLLTACPNNHATLTGLTSQLPTGSSSDTGATGLAGGTELTSGDVSQTTSAGAETSTDPPDSTSVGSTTVGASSSESGAACDDYMKTVEPEHPAVVLVIDKSGSMVADPGGYWDHDQNPNTPSVTRWQSLRAVVEEVVESHSVANDFGVVLCPSNAAQSNYDVTACPVSVPIDVPIASDNAAEILAVLPPAVGGGVKGASPTSAAILAATAELLGRPDQVSRHIVLVADGAASCQADAPDTTALFEEYDADVEAAVADAYAEGITTHVIGIGAAYVANGTQKDGVPDNVVVAETLETLAELGGGGAFINAFSQLQLLNAFEVVLHDSYACTVQFDEVPEYPLELAVSIANQPIPHLDTCGDEPGWAWVDAYTIAFCGSACEDFNLHGEAYCYALCEMGGTSSSDESEAGETSSTEESGTGESGSTEESDGTTDATTDPVGGTVCVPGSIWNCSDEPGKASDPALDGVGICRSAYRVCVDGTGWGWCIDPVLPKPEVCGCPDPNDGDCDPNLARDEDCDGSIDELENDNGCFCSPGDVQDCYAGNAEDLDVPNNACVTGLQTCTVNAEWGACVTDVTPSFDDEDCNPANGIEGCTTKSCDFDPLWWHSFGGVGKHINLAAYLSGNYMTAVTQVTVGSDTADHGNCFDGATPYNKTNFKGVTLARYQTSGPDPMIQFCQNPNLIEGNLDTLTIRADSGPTGSAVSGLAASAITPNLNGGLNGCATGIAAGTSFVARFSSTNTCQFRVVADAAVTMKDVAVGTTNGSTYVGLTLTGAQPVSLKVGNGVALPGCTFTVGAARSAYVKLGLDGMGNVTCTRVEYPAETVQALDVDSIGAVSIVYRVGAMGEQVRLRQLDSDLVLVWPTFPVDVTTTSLTATLAGGASFEPYGISANGQKIAVTGTFSGTMSSYGVGLESPGNDLDFVLLVADAAHPQRGASLTGQGDPNTGDLGDFGTAVEWVRVINPKTYTQTDGLVVAGNTFSGDFRFGPCWTDVNASQDPLALDGFIGVFRYSSGMNLGEQACVDHHALTGLGDQGIASLTVSDMRLGVCGYHMSDIYIGGSLVEQYSGNDKNAHCGVTVMPLEPL